MKFNISRRLVLSLSIFLLAVTGTFSRAYADLWADYSAAVADAEEEGTPEKISLELTAITPYNDDLIWINQASDERKLLVVTWGDEWYPENYQPGDEFIVSPAHPVWVTAGPEMKQWLRDNPVGPDELTMRIRQLLGMPPDASKTLFVEFWVSPDQIFRPSPDPEISDHEAELDFPDSPYFTIDTDYRDWFNDLRSTQYTWPWAMPWTRLGYTYDWGDQTDHVGMSEFIIRGDATVRIHSMTPTADYFASLPVVLNSGDYNGNGTSDVAVFRGSSGLWSVKGITRIYFGTTSDIPVPGDYNADGTTDIAVYRRSSGMWAVRGITRTYFGSSSDTPVPGDYDGDGSCDTGIFRGASGLWAIKNVTRVYLGSSGDRPVPGDFTGDGTTDIGIFRKSSGLWGIKDVSRIYFGQAGDTPVPGDFTGDGTWEAGVFRPENGRWYLRNLTRFDFGSSIVQPFLIDYDGDSTEDTAVWQDSLGIWDIRGISRFYYGSTGDIPATR